MPDYYADVRDFHLKFGHPVSDSPAHPSLDDEVFRAKLVREETQELLAALASEGLAEIAQECVDVLVVVLGTMVTYGLPLDPFWEAVHSANMAKEPNPAGGKPIKPAGWHKPDYHALLESTRSPDSSPPGA